MKKLEDALHELENLSKEEAANVNGGLVIIDVTCRETDKQKQMEAGTSSSCIYGMTEQQKDEYARKYVMEQFI